MCVRVCVQRILFEEAFSIKVFYFHLPLLFVIVWNLLLFRLTFDQWPAAIAESILVFWFARRIANFNANTYSSVGK